VKSGQSDSRVWVSWCRSEKNWGSDVSPVETNPFLNVQVGGSAEGEETASCRRKIGGEGSRSDLAERASLRNAGDAVWNQVEKKKTVNKPQLPYESGGGREGKQNG